MGRGGAHSERCATPRRFVRSGPSKAWTAFYARAPSQIQPVQAVVAEQRGERSRGAGCLRLKKRVPTQHLLSARKELRPRDERYQCVEHARSPCGLEHCRSGEPGTSGPAVGPYGQPPSPELPFTHDPMNSCRTHAHQSLLTVPMAVPLLYTGIKFGESAQAATSPRASGLLNAPCMSL